MIVNHYQVAINRRVLWQAHEPIRFLELLNRKSQLSIPDVMADFFQDGSMATLHRLGKPNVEQLERDLLEFSSTGPDWSRSAVSCEGTRHCRASWHHQRAEKVPYLKQIVVGIDGANSASWQRAKRIFGQLPQKPVLIWNDGPRIRRLIEQLMESDLDAGPTGKGRNLWLCFGYVLASAKSQMVAVHDCDILTYNRELLARLCYPVAHPNLGFDFCKGYSARFTDKLNGRVMRLLVTPLVRSLQSIIGENDFLIYMDTFRYPLSGEMSLDHDIIRRARIPADWGIEVGILAEVFRVSSPKSICQVDIAECYDHKHQELSPRDAQRGSTRWLWIS